MKIWMAVLVTLFIATGVEARDVVIPYDDFLKMLAKAEHRDKLLNQCMAEKAVLVKLNDEHGTIQKLTTKQVESLLATVETLEQVSAKDTEIQEALRAQLLSLTKELGHEKRLSRYKSEAFVLGVLGVVLLVVN